jgi:hypothetical protein
MAGSSRIVADQLFTLVAEALTPIRELPASH